jgi:hypothetical protein
MRLKHAFQCGVAAVALVMLVSVIPGELRAQSGGAVAIKAADIGGVVTGPSGPEAGVWVIAETTDLPTRFAKIVVTDDQGRYVIPELPKANYTIWVRGYGLVDTPKVRAAPGKLLNLKATPAPTAAAAAEYYPGVYWYSMLQIPDKSQFPGTGAGGNGISERMTSQEAWIDVVKHYCQACHALGDKGMRTLSPALGHFNNSLEAWQRRVQSGQSMSEMAVGLSWLGPVKALSLYADWTDRIAKGELPFAKPERPKGIERNVVISTWEWSSPKSYLHDEISTDKRNPTVNANGPIYGAPEFSTDLVPVLDPIKNTATTIKHPYLDPATPSSRDIPKGPSIYWGMEPIWDGHTSIHNPMMDEKGRVWFTARLRPDDNPVYCKQGSDHPSAKVAPVAQSMRQLSVYDPKTQKWSLINTCFATHHLNFGHDRNNTLWTSPGLPAQPEGVIGWLNTKMYDETGDPVKSQGWTPLVVDTNGNGKRDAYVEPGRPLDPTKDARVQAGFYGLQPSPIDDTVWGQSLDIGGLKSYVVHLIPGANPAETALAELFLPPDGGYGSRGIDLTSDGIVWTALSSGHLASFDRKKCTRPINGPKALSGQLCPEGWTLYKFPGPQFKGVTDQGSAEHAYFVWVDRFNTLGLGPNVPIATTNGGEALTALVKGKFVTLRVPYPQGFYSKGADGRIDDSNAGWKGRGLWTTTGSRAFFHGEGGVNARPRVFKLQIRPSPLAD